MGVCLHDGLVSCSLSSALSRPRLSKAQHPFPVETHLASLARSSRAFLVSPFPDPFLLGSRSPSCKLSCTDRSAIRVWDKNLFIFPYVEDSRYVEDYITRSSGVSFPLSPRHSSASVPSSPFSLSVRSPSPTLILFLTQHDSLQLNQNHSLSSAARILYPIPHIRISSSHIPYTRYI